MSDVREGNLIFFCFSCQSTSEIALSPPRFYEASDQEKLRIQTCKVCFSFLPRQAFRDALKSRKQLYLPHPSDDLRGMLFETEDFDGFFPECKNSEDLPASLCAYCQRQIHREKLTDEFKTNLQEPREKAQWSHVVLQTELDKNKPTPIKKKKDSDTFPEEIQPFTRSKAKVSFNCEPYQKISSKGDFPDGWSLHDHPQNLSSLAYA